MVVFLAAICGVLCVGGAITCLAGWRWHSRRVRSRRSRRLPRGGRTCGRNALVAGCLVAGIAGAVVTDTPLLALLVPALGLAVPTLLGRVDDAALELLQSLDRWVRELLAVLPTGRSVGDAVRLSVRQAPARLSGSLGLLVERLDNRWSLDKALLAMADELDSADADAVIAALSLATRRGGTGIEVTLSALADSMQERLRALREIEAERTKPWLAVRQVSVIMLVVLTAALIFSGGFFAPYGSAAGQVILALLASAYVGTLALLRRLAVPRGRQRILGIGQ